MKKKFFFICLSIIAVIASVIGLTACDNEVEEETYYTIMYTDGEEVHTLQVKYGELYSISKPLPSKEGYDFIGMFDAESGGTQYISYTGMCVSPFYDRKNVVLFPRFLPKTVTINLDYGPASGGTETLTVEYGATIPRLPSNLTAGESEKFIFNGWYTKADCGGVKVSDENGFASMKTEELINYIDDQGTIRLYAGFKVVTCNVTFYDCKDFSDSWNGYDSNPIIIKDVEYGSALLDVAPQTRKNGQKILGWSVGENSIEFTGEITSAQNFYVREYVVTIDYNSNGGETLSASSSSNREGISLKIPTRQYYEFECWTDNDGNHAYSGYFDKDKTLTAVWKQTHFNVIYDTDGGNSVLSMMTKAGDVVAFPDTRKSCYELTGWKYQNKIYKSDEKLIMPSNDITLTAQWLKTKYLVTFINVYGSNSSKEVKIGETINLNSPSATGRSFKGWSDGTDTYTSYYKPTSDVTLEAEWEADSYTVTLNANGGSVNKSTSDVIFDSTYNLPVPTKEGYQFVGWYSTPDSMGAQMTDSNGNSKFRWKTPSNLTVYAVWTKDFTIELNRQCCKTDNGFNPNEAGSGENIKSHENWEFAELVLKNCAHDERGMLYVPANCQLKLGISVLQNYLALPIKSSIGLNWYSNIMGDDNYTKNVYGTNISDKRIGYGAYYLKIDYEDGTFKEINKTGVFKNTKQGDYIEIDIGSEQSKSIVNIEFVLVYELQYEFYNWLWHTQYSNWRCCATLKFV